MEQVNNRSSKLVARWLLLGVVMTIIQVALGGITRLTGSGLSITEWDVITGTLPPLNERAWLAEFEKYRATPQFQLLNFEFGLSDFKFIFFWEWFHRLWARLIGLVFAGGFIWFIIGKHFKKEMVRPLVVLFLLGALQGAIGWIMVASGLTGDAVYVKPTRLALHFIFALGLLCYTFWFALKLLIPEQQRVAFPSLRKINLWLIGLLVLQLLYGALMAGHKAANVAASWPKINGDWVPDSLFSHKPFLLNFIDNKILIHFVHRGLAYLILIWIIIWTIQLAKHKGSLLFENIKRIPLYLTFLQVLLGILTILTSTGIIPGKWGTFEWMAQLHQLTGMCLLLSLFATLFVLSKQK
ncbi:COX15/CtaA family protein [Sediminibacterium goheungense]|uniref:Cytochrome c oxidase assembly protein subunit 15 n=1 Tax=Sediminibacterium goheungense TaxID=1086393 RepID=A0A4R6IVC9_9BACT|nr:COX15/CtaA family protein [Sediminibacterium goheungense]TDO26590.1 cytochrome c oxidase assembly protein subunit 15 [Sediminibacterium goheungense]